MRQALHIFVKDTRRLRYDVIVTLVLVAAFAWCLGHRAPAFDPQTAKLYAVAELLRLLLPFAWWYLVARAIYGEPLPGDRQFWVTRPYRWKSLLGAKILFIAVFVILPLLLSDCAILTLQGFSPSDHRAGLAWHPLVFSIVFLLPVAALACVTVSIAQMALTFLAAIAILVVLGLSGIGPTTLWFGSLDWVRSSLAFLVVLLGALTVMILQYCSRRTGLSRILAGATLGLALIAQSFLPWTIAFALQSRLAKSHIDTSLISGQFQPGGRPPAAASPVADTKVKVRLPIGFSGVPLGMAAAVDDMAGELVLPDGELSKPMPMSGSDKDKPWYTMPVERSMYERVKSTPLRVHVIILLTVYGNLHTERMPLEGNSHRVPGIGVCAAQPFELQKATIINCLVPFRLPVRTLAQFENGVTVEGQGESLHTPYPADFGFSPIDFPTWQLPNEAGATAIVFTTMQPLAHIRREVDIPNVQLAEFAN
jgi:hypothetical protein